MLQRSLLLVSLVATFAQGKELRVPADYGTIQSAIEASANGDEIVVAAGTYHERLDTRGKKVVIRSSDGAAATILDGANLGQAILTATDGESLATTIRGFTFRNGEGTLTTACGFLNARLGGAIFLLNSGVSIVDCIFEDNGVTKIVAGGAICACRSNIVIASGSPCIDAGDNGAVDPAVRIDLAGRPRFIDDPSTTDKGIGAAPVVDVGAFEFQPARRRAAGHP